MTYKPIIPPRFFQSTQTNNFRGSQVLSSPDLLISADGVNHLLARGNHLISTFSPEVPDTHETFQHWSSDTDGTTYVWWVLSPASYQNLDQVWEATIIGPNPETLTSISASYNSFATWAAFNPFSANSRSLDSYGPDNPLTISTQILPTLNPSHFIFPGLVSSNFGLLVSSSTTQPEAFGGYLPGPRVMSISARELPRYQLDPVSESFSGGVDFTSLQYDEPIFDSGIDQYASPIALGRSTVLAHYKSKRMAHFTWSVPIFRNGQVWTHVDTPEGYNKAITTTSFVDGIFRFPVQLSPRYRNETSGSVNWYALIQLANTDQQENFGAVIEVSSALGSFPLILTSSTPEITGSPTWISGSFEATRTNIFDPRQEGYHDNQVLVNAALAGGSPANTILAIWTFQVIDPQEDVLSITSSLNKPPAP